MVLDLGGFCAVISLNILFSQVLRAHSLCPGFTCICGYDNPRSNTLWLDMSLDSISTLAARDLKATFPSPGLSSPQSTTAPARELLPRSRLAMLIALISKDDKKKNSSPRCFQRHAKKRTKGYHNPHP